MIPLVPLVVLITTEFSEQNYIRMVKKKKSDPHQFRQHGAQREVKGRWDKYTLGFTEGVLWTSNSKAALDKIKNSLEK